MHWETLSQRKATKIMMVMMKMRRNMTEEDTSTQTHWCTFIHAHANTSMHAWTSTSHCIPMNALFPLLSMRKTAQYISSSSQVTLCLSVNILFFGIILKESHSFSVVHYGLLLEQLPSQPIYIHNRTSFCYVLSDKMPTSQSIPEENRDSPNFNILRVIHSKFLWILGWIDVFKHLSL